MELVQFAIGFVIVMSFIIAMYNNAGEKQVKSKKDYSNEELSKAFAHGCVNALFGETKKNKANEKMALWLKGPHRLLESKSDGIKKRC